MLPAWRSSFHPSRRSGQTANSAGINQITAPTTPTAVLRGYVTDPNEVRVVTINSVPDLIITAPFALQVCLDPICEGVDDVFNYTTLGYNDVTGLGVPFLGLQWHARRDWVARPVPPAVPGLLATQDPAVGWSRFRFALISAIRAACLVSRKRK